MHTVSDWMIASPTTVAPDTPLIEAEWRMHAEKIRHLPVLDDAGRLVGILSDRDVREAVPSRESLSIGEMNYRVATLDADDAMRSPVITAHPDDLVDKAARTMLEHRISCLPVLDDDELVGILTTTDLLEALLERLGVERDQAPVLGD